MFATSPTFDAVAAGAPAGVALTILLESVLDASPLPLHAPRPAAITMRYRRIDTPPKFETFPNDYRLPPHRSALTRRHRHAHGVVAFVDVHGVPRDRAGQRRREKRRRFSDLFRGQLLGERGVRRYIFDHLLDDSNRARCARREWTRRDRVDTTSEFASGLEGERACIAFQRRLRRRHAAAVSRNHPLTGHVRERQ